MENNQYSLRTLWSFISPYRKQLGLLCIVSAVTALLDGIVILVLFDFVHFVISQDVETSRFVIWILTPLGLSSFSFQVIAVVFASFMGAMSIIRFSGSVLLERNVNRLRGQVLVKIQDDLMKSHLCAPWRYFWHKKQGEMLYHITGYPPKATEVFLHLSKIVAAGMMLIVIPSVLFFMSPLLFLVGIFLASGYFLLIHRLGRKVSYYTGKERVEASRIQNALAAEALAGIRYIKAYGYGEKWLDNFSTQVRRFADLMVKDSFWIALPPRLMELFVVLVFLILIISSITLIGDKFVESIPTLGAYLFGIMRLVPSLSQIGSARMQLQGNLPYIESLEKTICELKAEDHEARGPFAAMEKGPVCISLEDVVFSYEPGRSVLNKFTFKILPSKITALVGESGSGKSTILDLILGFIQPQKGQIVINGKPLISIDINDWRSRIALVGQDVFLFHDTIEANLRMGFPDAPFEKVEEAADIANILEFVNSLPDKWQTVLGDRGINLSGGQRQRFALARALLRDPDVYLLDEPTSALDDDTEQNIMSSFLSHVREKTVVLVAHRLQTIKYADIKLTISNGTVADTTNYEIMNSPKGTINSTPDKSGAGLSL